MKTKLLCMKMALFAFACFVSVSMFGQTQITNEAGLRAIANNLSGRYILMNDITLTGQWVPIGTDANRFTGEINGNGKTIYGLKCQYLEKDSVGFISVAQDAIIKDLRIVGAEVYGRKDVGILIGTSYFSRIEQCYTSGAVGGVDHVGGLVGGTRAGTGDLAELYTTINNCFSTAAVGSSSWQSGGIIGAAIYADVSNTYFAGVAVCKSGRSAGIIALSDAGASSIKNSVVMSPYIKGDEAHAVLGAVNENASCRLSTNYSWDETKVYVKEVQVTDRISNIEGNEGQLESSAKLKSVAFYMDDLVWDSDIWKVKEGNYPLFEGQTYPLMADGIYVPSFAERLLPGTTFSAKASSGLGRDITYNSSNPAVATIDSEGLVTFIQDGVTTLTFTTVGDAYSQGATTTREITVKGISYNITSENDLRAIKYDLAGTYTLMNNITLTKDWELLDKFTGTLNGDGKIIYGLKYAKEDQNEVGLFGLAEGATVTKLGIEQANLLGNQNVGAIIGKAAGCTISECYVANSYIAGRDHVGSIVGEVKMLSTTDEEGGVTTSVGTVVSNCHSGASVYSREYQAGGIAGTICGGTVENCYFSGKAQADKGRAAGIIALVDTDDEVHVKNNINLGAAIYCKENTFRIVQKGDRANATLENNWSVVESYLGADQPNSATKNNEYDPTSDNGCNVDDDGNARSASFYTQTLSWDFNNIWHFIEGTEGKMYPVLKWQNAPVVSNIYGIPNPAYLVWTPDADASLDLKKIIASCGQELTIKVAEDEISQSLVEKDGDQLYVAEKVGQRGTAKMLLTSALKDVITMVDATEFNVDVIRHDDVLDISTVSDLLDVNNKLFANFRLKNNINMTGVEFTGIGSADARYTGTFDGNGYSIINPVVKTNDGNKKGFFNATKDAKIKNLGIKNFSFSGSKTSGSNSTDLGGLVGSCQGTTIDQCYLTGKVVGRDHVGGFIGGESTDVTITNSYVNAEVNSYSQAGGFFGVTAGDNIVVKNSYFAGSVKAADYGWAGGFIGLVDYTGAITITNCASIGDVSGSSASGAFIGGNGTKPEEPRATLTFTGNIKNADATINSNVAWIDQTVAGGTVNQPTDKSSLELRYKVTYPDWDFNNIWIIETEGAGYPKLKNVPELKDDDSGISIEQASNHAYTVIAVDNVIRVSGMKEVADVTLYTINGQILSQVKATDGTVDLPVSGKGFYIVRITENNKTTSVKVINK